MSVFFLTVTDEGQGFCVPGAITAVTDMPQDKASDAISRRRG
jgi:hypothetical protein